MRSSEVQGELWGRDPATWAHEFESQMQPLAAATSHRFDRSSAHIHPNTITVEVAHSGTSRAPHPTDRTGAPI
jgi:hypothetical protein